MVDLTPRGFLIRVGVVTVVLAVSFAAVPSVAASDGWESHGPPGGPVQALAIGAGAPDRVWAGTMYPTYWGGQAGHLAVSVNGAATWQEVARLRLEPIGEIAVDPTNADVVYAGATCAYCEGIYRTVDGGRTWSLLGEGFERTFIESIAVDPVNPQTVYAGTLIDGTWKSVDGGATWTPINAGMGYAPVFSLLVDPFDHLTVYAGLQKRGTFRSIDGGATWSPANAGMGEQKVNALVADPTLPGHLYAGAAHGVYESLDGGDTWESVSQGLDGHGISSLVMASGDPRLLYAGSASNGGWRSSDGGEHWVSFGAPLSGGAAIALAVDPRRDDVVYAGTGSGVMKSFDRGQTWERRTTGLSNSATYSIGVGDGVLYAGERDQGGVYRSVDDGDTWLQASEGLPRPAFVTALAVDPSRPKRVYAGLDGRGIYRSSDAGLHWSPVAGGPFGTESIRIAPSDPRRIYADGTGGNLRKLFRSSDGGGSWDDVTDPTMTGSQADFAIDPFDADHVFAMLGQVYESSNGGDSWHLASNGLPTDRAVDGLAIDRFDPDLLYAGTDDDDLYRTTDGGAHWVVVDLAACVRAVSTALPETDPSHQGVVYVPTHQGACRGTASGQTWTPLPDLARGYVPEDMAVAPDGSALYVATHGSGLLRYTT